VSEINKPMIALDAMGGDHGPSVVVPGAVAALSANSPFGISLYGDETAVNRELAKLDTDGLALDVVHCSQDIGMEESPASAIRSKKRQPHSPRHAGSQTKQGSSGRFRRINRRHGRGQFDLAGTY
jgi:fatty acid/phospholipid biosynthesis enzyme